MKKTIKYFLIGHSKKIIIALELVIISLAALKISVISYSQNELEKSVFEAIRQNTLASGKIIDHLERKPEGDLNIAWEHLTSASKLILAFLGHEQGECVSTIVLPNTTFVVQNMTAKMVHPLSDLYDSDVAKGMKRADGTPCESREIRTGLVNP